MIKDTLTANEAVLPNSREMAVLKEYFPACFHDDGSFDLARFQEFLSDKVAITNEGYEIRFLGKNYARLLSLYYKYDKNTIQIAHPTFLHIC